MKKINKEQLMALLKNSTNSEFSLSELIEITENMPQEPQPRLFDGIPVTEEEPHYMENFLKQTGKVRLQKDTQPTATLLGGFPSSLDNFETDNVKEEVVREPNMELPNYIQQLIDNGYIRDPKYAQVLARNKGYMTYLEENPILFLEKRIEWKINKLVGLTSYNVEAKDLYADITEEIVESQSVRDLEALLLERLHIPKERLTNVPLIDLIYLLDAYGVDTLKTLFFLIRSSEATIHFFADKYYSTDKPRTLRDLPLSDLSIPLLSIKNELTRQISNAAPVVESRPIHIIKSLLKIINLLDVDELKSKIGIHADAVIGNLIDPLAHTYKERRRITRQLNKLYRFELAIETQSLDRFKYIHKVVKNLATKNGIVFPYDKSVEEIFLYRKGFINSYEDLVNHLMRRLNSLA